jgi:ApaG protein
MAYETPYRAITRSIAVSVEPTYLEARSLPGDAQYFWAYRIVIENQGQETVQLISRHWMITNARGEFSEVKGAGVVGEQPVLKPGESHEYTSGVPLDTPSGMMGGAYQMVTENGDRFDIEIPTFSLDVPNPGVAVN